MQITSVTVEPLNLELQSALNVAYGSYPILEYALVKLHTDNGLLGLGEASPDPQVTGETQAGVVAALQQMKVLLIGQDPADIQAILSACKQAIPAYPAALAAIDMALYDLLGQGLGVSVYTLLGGKTRPAMQLYPVIPLDEPLVMASMCKYFVDMGAETLKIKLGSVPANDLLRLKAIHDAVGSAIKLRLDINQGWQDAPTAIQTIRQLDVYNIAYIEQPVAAADLAGMAAVCAAVETPIMADESCHTPADVYKIASMQAADWINIKLMKCGGISSALEMLAVADAAGLPCILGSMGESSLGSAAGLHLCIARAGIHACELIGPLFINNDPAEGFQVDPATFRAMPSQQPGLGVQLK
jgi:L-Ala-D/L-Glu epimerase